jgi:serine/threonine protein phosphatase PrpC
MIARSGWAQDIGVLWGDQHPVFGVIESLALDSRCAIALSAGRLPKPTPKVDPNEDAVLAILGTDGYVLAVADGHRGSDAARGALMGVAAAAAGAAPDAAARPERFVSDLFRAAASGVAATLENVEEARQRSRTALTLTLVARGKSVQGTAGDTVVTQLGRRSWRRTTSSAPYLGPHGPLPRARRRRLRKDLPLVSASDGLTDFLGADWRSIAADALMQEDSPEPAARALVQAACAAGAGDNIAVAVLFGPHHSLPEQPLLGFRSPASGGLRLLTRVPASVHDSAPGSLPTSQGGKAALRSV